MHSAREVTRQTSPRNFFLRGKERQPPPPKSQTLPGNGWGQSRRYLVAFVAVGHGLNFVAHADRVQPLAHKLHGLHAAQVVAQFVLVKELIQRALTLAGGVFGQPTRSLGVDKFGQSGLREAVYGYVGIGVKDIVSAGFACVD